MRKEIDFEYIKSVAANNALAVLQRWLPDGKVRGNEYVALNPRRADSRHGSFSINLITGKWADFATGDKGGDLISLAAYIFNIKQAEAAKQLARMLGMGGYENES